MLSKLRKRGISQRIVHLALLILILFFSGTVVYSTFRLTETFIRVSAYSKQNTELQNASYELMKASDYLTEKVQRFTISGDEHFMKQYFEEAFESKRREEAISKMQADDRTDAALKQLQTAMDNSLQLMELEYYAMRLVIEAKGYTDYPEILDSVTLSEEDAALKPEDKSLRATQIVLGDEYYEMKEKIRAGMQGSLEEVEKLTADTEERELMALNRDLRVTRVAVLIQAISVVFTMWLTWRLVLYPVLNAVVRIKDDHPIPETGSREFRYLASAYNKMYKKNKANLAALSFKASHDELTGAYNRSGYDLLMSNLDLESTYMLLFDVDDFKNINDTYGHDVGDKVLIKLVNVLKNMFRGDDCICRIGGDEFVVFAVHSAGMKRRIIESKLEQINAVLADTSDGLPPISISVGIMNGKDATDSSHLYEKTDEAMYKSKKTGKNKYTFYSN